MPGGDAKLLRWTKGVDIKEMIGKYIGNPLLNYLNEKNKIKFTDIKVLNDTVASLFAGLTDNSYDAYIGLIVGCLLYTSYVIFQFGTALCFC